MKNCPKISIIMPVYNCEKFIEPALVSILNQTERDFELLIWNDGSNDKTVEIIKRYNDPRITIYESENRGLSAALNSLLERCAGDYICRMDGDDISHPKRLEKQLEYLINNPNVILVGTRVNLIIDSTADVQTMSVLCKHQEILDDIAFLGFPICHPSIMFRSTVVTRGVRYRFNFGEENDFFVQCSTIGELSNLEMPLLYYRLGAASHSVGEKALLHEKFWFDTAKFTYNEYCEQRSLILNLLFRLNSNSKTVKLFCILKAKSRNYYRKALIKKIQRQSHYLSKVLAIVICPILIIRLKNLRR